MKAEYRGEKPDPYRLRRLVAVLASAALLLGSLWFARTYNPRKVEAFAPETMPCLVIDPGHGGHDSGALAYNGVRESDLNLAIALKLRDLAWFYGVETRMTRQDDTPRTDRKAYSEHEDLVYRAETAEAAENGVLISIHQNTFPTSQPSGCQVLYGPGGESRRLGELTHRNLVEQLEPENRRVAEPASRTLYLTSHVSCPVILVECGFLSNLDDLLRLCDSRFQCDFAAVLLYSFLQFAYSEPL